jgi:hypothetical protein
LQQPEPEIKEQTGPKHPDHAVWIENQNYTWGVQTCDIDEMFDNMIMEMKGETKAERDAKKTEKQLLEENEEKLER